MSELCSVCCTNRMTPSRIITCASCEFTCCRDCVERYVLSSADDPHCMSCKVELPRDAFAQLMTKRFMNTTYRDYRQEQLYQRELALMPSSQPYVEQELQRRRNEKMLDSMLVERNNLKRKLRELENACYTVRENMTPPVAKREFVHRCANNGCKGFLSTAWKCSVCSEYTCQDCGAVCRHGHECNADDKASFELIKKDSRRCPGCAAYIFKIDGCNQMWCTACHCAFDFRTGRKINGQIHNPHAIDFLRRRGTGGRDMADVPCGGRPGFGDLQRITSDRPTLMRLSELLRMINHIDDVEMPRYASNDVNRNVSLRVKYCLNEIDADDLKAELNKREKRDEKRRAFRLVLEMLLTVASDMLRGMVVQRSCTQEPHTLTSLEALFRYANQQFGVIGRRYDCIAPFLRIENPEGAPIRCQFFTKRYGSEKAAATHA